MKRTIMGYVVLVAFRAVALLLLVLSIAGTINTYGQGAPYGGVILAGTLTWAGLLWWGGGRLTLPEGVKTHAPGEVVPLARLQEVFPEFDVKEGDFIKRDGKLFRVNSNGMQVLVNGDTLWSFQLRTGEYLKKKPQQSAGYNMVLTAPFSERLRTYDAKKREKGAALVTGVLACAFAAVLLAFAGLTLTGTIAIVCLVIAGLLAAAVVAGAVKYARETAPENLIGPEPLRRRASDFGDKIETPARSEPSDARDETYKIPL